MFLSRFFHKQSDTRARVYRTIALSFFGISLAIALIVFYISFSWATITIIPEVTTFDTTTRVAMQEKGASTEALSGKIIERELEGAGTFVPSAVETKSSRFSGVLTVVNRTNRSQRLIQTTRFLSANDVLLRSQESAVVPAGGSVDIPVAADTDGDIGKIDTSRFTIPGLREPLQGDIYGAAFKQTTGTEQSVRKVTAPDIERAEQEVVKKLEEKFALLLDAEKASFSAPSVRSAYRSEVVKRTNSHAVDEQTDEFSLRLTVRFTGVLLNEQELTQRLMSTLQTKMSTGYDLLPIGPEQIAVTLDSADTESGQASLSIRATGSKVRSDDIRSYHTRDLAGLPKDAIIEYFRGYDDIKDIRVSFTPFWVTRAPFLIDHIKIIVDTSSAQ
ncbi:MAG: hypothetical protein AAB855_04165 [Patescibacteria group bacterium]